MFFLKCFQIDLTSFYYFLVVLKVGFPTAKQTGEAVKKFSDFLGELGTAQLALLGIGGACGATSLTLYIYTYINSFCKELDGHLARVNTELQKAHTEYNVQEIQFNKKLKERMKRQSSYHLQLKSDITSFTFFKLRSPIFVIKHWIDN